MTPASLAVLLAMALLLTPMVQANSVGTVPLVDQGNQALRKCGAARLKVLFWDIYESSLYTPDGTWSEGVRPLRLDIRYLRAISALDLVKQTGKEWAEQGIVMKYDRIHRVLGEGDFVLVVSEGSLAGNHTSFYDLFRVADGKIASVHLEHSTLDHATAHCVKTALARMPAPRGSGSIRVEVRF